MIPAPVHISSKERLKKSDKLHNNSASKIDTQPVIIKRLPKKRENYAPKKIIPKTEIMMARSPALPQPVSVAQGPPIP